MHIIIFAKEFPCENFSSFYPLFTKDWLVWSVLVFYNQTSRIPTAFLSRLTTNICEHLISVQENRHLRILGSNHPHVSSESILTC